MDDYIEVKIDVFEHVSQRASLRKSLTVSALIGEILKEFDDISADSPGKYAVFLKGTDRPLDANSTLMQLDIQPQDELVFNYGKQTNRQMLDPRNYAALRDESLNRMYDIQWQPAIIGRPTNDADHNIMLAVNLQLHPKGQTVSRKHAQITFSQGSYFIEPLADNNPIAVNGKVVPLNSRKLIRSGDRIMIGRSDLQMTFTTQVNSPINPALREAAAAPAAQKINPPQASAPAPVSAAAVVPPPVRPAPVVTTSAPAAPAVPAAVQPQSVPVSTPIEEGRTVITPEAQPAALIVERSIDPAKIGKSLSITDFPILLGRDLPLFSGEGEISRRHAEINFDTRSGKYFITDLKSTNGTKLGETRLEPERPYEMSKGSRLSFGLNFTCRFEG